MIAAKEIYGYRILVYSKNDLKLYQFTPTKCQSYGGAIRLLYTGSHYDCICFGGLGKEAHHIPLENRPNPKVWDTNTKLYGKWFKKAMNKCLNKELIDEIFDDNDNINDTIIISDDDDIDILNNSGHDIEKEKKIDIHVDIGSFVYIFFLNWMIFEYIFT